MLKIVSEVIAGFKVHGFLTAVLGALIVVSVSRLLDVFVGGHGKVERTSCIDLQKKGGRWE
jgi:uncharacterized membrane protein YvlD (DUF360 family)